MHAEALDRARAALASYDATVDGWEETCAKEERTGEPPSVRACENYSDALEQDAHVLADALRSVLEATSKLDAAQVLANLDPYAWFDLATNFTCIEAEALADFLRAFHGDSIADSFLTDHATGDEWGDSHMPVYNAEGVAIGWEPRNDDEEV